MSYRHKELQPLLLYHFYHPNMYVRLLSCFSEQVWVHSLDGPRDIPPRPNQTAAPASDARQTMVSSLVDMGFAREQVEPGPESFNQKKYVERDGIHH